MHIFVLGRFKQIGVAKRYSKAEVGGFKLDHINPKIDSLTSLRFFAAALIVLGHSAGMFGLPADWLGGLATYQGVTFFFVLSGFILTYVYPSLDSSTESLRFIAARIARIWPAHFATFLLSFFLLSWVPATLHTGQGWLIGICNLMLLHAWVPFSAFYFSFNGPSWSISAELFFYVNFIWLINKLEKTWKTKLVIALLGASLMMIIWRVTGTLEHDDKPYSLNGDGLIYVSPLARIFEFVVGMCFAVLFKKLKHTNVYNLVNSMAIATAVEVTLLSMVAIQLVFFGATWFELGPPIRIFPIELTFWLERSGSAPLYGLTIMAFAFQQGTISKMLANKGFVLLGEISYSIYLLHQMIFFFFRDHPAILAGIPNPLAYMVVLAVTITGAYLMWRFMERPLRNRIASGAYALIERVIPDRLTAEKMSRRNVA